MTVSVADFEFVRRLVRERSAVVLDDGKEYLVQARLAPLAQREGLASVGALVDLARSGSARLPDEIVAAMATKETSFFRDAHPFAALRSDILPRLLATQSRPLRVWSAAASTGQEAYSLAMLLYAQFPAAPPASILATDLADDAVSRGRAGRYTQLEVNRGLPARLLVTHFHRDGLHWRVNDTIRRLVQFRQLNLVQSWPPIPPMDIVLMRNVLIYFDTAARKSVLARVARILRPGGYLMLGASETTHGLGSPFEPVTVGRSVCYRLPLKEAMTC